MIFENGGETNILTTCTVGFFLVLLRPTGFVPKNLAKQRKIMLPEETSKQPRPEFEPAPSIQRSDKHISRNANDGGDNPEVYEAIFRVHVRHTEDGSDESERKEKDSDQRQDLDVIPLDDSNRLLPYSLSAF